MLQKKQTTVAAVNPCSTMESGNHSKNGASLKSLMSRRNLLVVMTILCFGVFMGACKDGGNDDDNTPLSAPTGVTAVQVEEGIKVSWNSVKEAVEYELYVTCNNSKVDGYRVYDCSTVFKPKTDGEYSFQVRACNYDESSDWSYKVSCDYTDPNVLRTPTGLTAIQVKDSIRVSWNPVKVAENYLLHVSDDKNWSKNYTCYGPGISFYNLINGAKYTFQVKACRGYESTDWSEPVSCVYSAPSGGTATGLYMGIVGFNEELNEKGISLLTDYKNTYNTNKFTSFIYDLEMKPATSLYYAVDNAIKRLENAVLPEDLVNVSIVTFTDGLDNASIALNTAYTSRDAYRDDVQKRIINTRIKTKEINAYSVGIRGKDITDYDAFRKGLVAMASHDSSVYELVNMSEVDETFRELANRLYSENESLIVNLKMTTGIEDGTKIRFTFDDVTEAVNSEVYIEGIFKRIGTTAVMLENVEYHGVKSSVGTTITGNVSDLVYATFSFKDFVIEKSLIIDLKEDTQKWEYISTTNKWQVDSEFGKEGDVETAVDKKSAAIVLVLDCTSSLGSDGFNRMKEAATNFIEILTNK